MIGRRLSRDFPFVFRIGQIFLVMMWYLTAGGSPVGERHRGCAAYEQQRQPKDVDRVNLQGILFVRQHGRWSQLLQQRL